MFANINLNYTSKSKGKVFVHLLVILMLGVRHSEYIRVFKIMFGLPQDASKKQCIHYENYDISLVF